MSRFNDSTSDQVGEYYQAQSWRQEGVKEERERIIKLLEEFVNTYPQPSEESEALWEAIDLIKGESNE